MHLTNYSINKKNSEYEANTDENVCQGHKWLVYEEQLLIIKHGIVLNIIFVF